MGHPGSIEATFASWPSALDLFLSTSRDQLGFESTTQRADGLGPSLLSAVSSAEGLCKVISKMGSVCPSRAPSPCCHAHSRSQKWVKNRIFSFLLPEKPSSGERKLLNSQVVPQRAALPFQTRCYGEGKPAQTLLGQVGLRHFPPCWSQEARKGSAETEEVAVLQLASSHG